MLPITFTPVRWYCRSSCVIWLLLRVDVGDKVLYYSQITILTTMNIIFLLWFDALYRTASFSYVSHCIVFYFFEIRNVYPCQEVDLLSKYNTFVCICGQLFSLHYIFTYLNGSNWLMLIYNIKSCLFLFTFKE